MPTAPGQIALAWLMARKPWIVPIPGTTQMAHMLENNGASAIRFTAAQLSELNAAVLGIEVRGQPLPDAVLVFSGVEAAPKKSPGAEWKRTDNIWLSKEQGPRKHEAKLRAGYGR